MKRLEGKVAIVTGSDRGIGKGIAIAFAKEGCNVVISDHKGDKPSKDAVNEIKKLGSSTIFVKADVSKAKDMENLVKKAVQKFGKIDIMVNNAGILVSGTVLELTEKDWEKQMSVNLKGVFLGTKYAVAQMKRQGKAGIVGFPGISAYCASKGGVTEFTREVALDHAKDGITVNAINPGVIVTDMTKAMLNDKESSKALLENTPIGRFGQPEDIGNAAVFLALDASSFITGHNLVVDGGWTAR
ncbi:glucose 1-dehydrogenase [Candidatus Woesearchaeota archaeon]|nr:glucose 1-dehydrogenase [Candidatus Woesearchaeota archaeon]